MIKTPCKGCADRTTGEVSCHATCDRYEQFKAEREQEKQRIESAAKDENVFLDYMANRSKARDKKWRSKIW